jgi:uncharacterized protein (TIGR02757 family)
MNYDFLISLADKYETPDFIIGDPSFFMHQVSGEENQETIALVASTLSYGARSQFMPKIDLLLKASDGLFYEWIKTGAYNDSIPRDTSCFYRLYNNTMMLDFFDVLRRMLKEYHTIGNAVKTNANDGLKAINFFCNYFTPSTLIPHSITSPCKRLAMFLRWMVRIDSPVDLGLWKFIDRRTLVIPLDSHVIKQSHQLGLMTQRNPTMKTAIMLTDKMRTIFPDDPTRADFALFGLGVNSKPKTEN